MFSRLIAWYCGWDDGITPHDRLLWRLHRYANHAEVHNWLYTRYGRRA